MRTSLPGLPCTVHASHQAGSLEQRWAQPWLVGVCQWPPPISCPTLLARPFQQRFPEQKELGTVRRGQTSTVRMAGLVDPWYLPLGDVTDRFPALCWAVHLPIPSTPVP